MLLSRPSAVTAVTAFMWISGCNGCAQPGGLGEGEGEVASDGCLLDDDDFAVVTDPGLDTGPEAWDLENGEVATESGDTRVAFRSTAVCEGGGSVTQTVAIPAPCEGLTPAYRASTGDGGVGHAFIFDGMPVPLPTTGEPFCLGDGVWGREVRFGVRARSEEPGVLPGNCGSVSDATRLIVRELNIVSAACPASGSVVLDPAQWRGNIDGNANYALGGDAFIELRADDPCATALVSGPHSGTFSVPSTMEHPALSFVGQSTMAGNARIEVQMTYASLGTLGSFAGRENLCLPRSARGNVERLALRLAGPAGSCADAATSFVAIDGIAVVDDESCAGPSDAFLSPDFSDERYFVVEGGTLFDDDGVALHADNHCGGSRLQSLVQLPPPGDANALAIRYSFSGPDGARLMLHLDSSNLFQHLLDQTDGAVVTTNLCLNPFMSNEVRRLSLEHGIITETPCSEDLPLQESSVRIEHVDIVADASCDPMQ